MKVYNTLSQLLQERRSISGLTQIEVSSKLGVSERTYRRWEAGTSHINFSNIHDLAEQLSVPFEVLLRLSYNYPVLYSITSHRYAHCPFDKDYVNRKVLTSELFDTEETGRVFSLKEDKHLRQISQMVLFSYPYKRSMPEQTVVKAASLLPQINLLIRDPIGFVSGHLISLPLNLSAYNALKNRDLREFDIKSIDLTKPIPHTPSHIHLYSFFAVNSTYVYCLAKALIRFLLTTRNIHPDSTLSRYTVTRDGIELCKKLGMVCIDIDNNAREEYRTEESPHFFEIKISEMQWLNKYRQKTR